MTVREYLQRPERLRYLVAAPAAAASPARELDAVVLSAHRRERAAMEAIRWERGKLRRDRGDPELTVVRIVIDLDQLLPEGEDQPP